MVKKTRLVINTTGGAGISTGNARTEETLMGRIARIDIDWNAAAPAGTSDLTIYEIHRASASFNIYKLLNSVTDVSVCPTVGLTTVDGTACVYDANNEPVVQAIPVCDEIYAIVEGCDDLSPACTIDIYWEE